MIFKFWAILQNAHNKANRQGFACRKLRINIHRLYLFICLLFDVFPDIGKAFKQESLRVDIPTSPMTTTAHTPGKSPNLDQWRLTCIAVDMTIFSHDFARTIVLNNT